MLLYIWTEYFNIWFNRRQENSSCVSFNDLICCNILFQVENQWFCSALHVQEQWFWESSFTKSTKSAELGNVENFVENLQYVQGWLYDHVQDCRFLEAHIAYHVSRHWNHISPQTFQYSGTSFQKNIIPFRCTPAS